MDSDNLESKFSIAHSLAYEINVRDACVKNMVTVSPHESMSDLRAVLRQRRISGVPVMEGDKLVGIISIEDLIKCIFEGKANEPISEWMNRDVKVLYGDEKLYQAIMKFGQLPVGRFPVLDRESGNIIGILTKGNIIRALLRKLESTRLEEEIHRIRASHIFEDLLADEVSLRFKYIVAGKDFKKGGDTSLNFQKTLNRLGIAPQAVRRVSIATYEAEINMVSYTDGGIIMAAVNPDKIKVVVRDNGPGIPDIELAMRPGYSTAPDWIRELGFGAGMGLCNIKKCSDTMDLKSKVGKGTVLKFTVNLSGKEGK